MRKAPAANNDEWTIPRPSQCLARCGEALFMIAADFKDAERLALDPGSEPFVIQTHLLKGITYLAIAAESCGFPEIEAVHTTLNENKGTIRDVVEILAHSTNKRVLLQGARQLHNLTRAALSDAHAKERTREGN